MYIGFADEITKDVRERVGVYIVIEDGLKEYLRERHYGADVEKIYIGLITVSKKFSSFFMRRKNTPK